ncbi:MAG: hypothetical protein HKN91_16465 [Acidimicrobiia bacterium]|nr:hypothetical protein [Acidimicrobiia bacterium]
MPSQETLEALGSEEFMWGLAFGFAALAIGALAIYVWRQWRERPVAIVSLLAAGAAVAASAVAAEPPRELWTGVALLAGAGALYPLVSRLPLLPAALAAPGAWWVTNTVDLPGAGWVPWALLAWIVVGGTLLADFDRHHEGTGYCPLLLVISVAGMFATLPDTEQILVVFGAVLPLAVLSWPRGFAALGPIGVYPLLGVLAWVIAVGGQGRESAVIGAMAALGLLAVEPLVRWWGASTIFDVTSPRWRRFPVIALGHLAVVLLMARGAGLAASPMRAAGIAVAIAAAAAVGLALASGARPEAAP